MAEGNYDDQITAMQMQIKQLQRENQKMQTALTEVAYANVLPTVLQNGFADVINELRPLRDLTPSRQPLKADVAAAISGTLKAMEGVTLTGGSLSIPEVSVPFIGQPALLPPGQADPYQTPGKPQQILGEGYRP